jgi:acetolactate synthase regulatory subunit
LFKRYGVVNRILGGWAFQMSKTNIIESQNMGLKSNIDDNTPVQILIRKLEKLVNGRKQVFIVPLEIV